MPVMCHCQGQGPFRGLSLMIVFGGGCLNVCNEVRGFAFSRNNEVTNTTVPAGTSTAVVQCAGRISAIW